MREFLSLVRGQVWYDEKNIEYICIIMLVGAQLQLDFDSI